LRRPADGGAYAGTLILISHDRALIDAVCDNLVTFDHDSNVSTYAGNYTQWRESREARQSEAGRMHAAQAHHRPAPKGDPRPEPSRREGDQMATRPAMGKAPPRAKSSRFSWMPLEKLETAITETTARIRSIDADLVKPETYADKDRFQSLLDELAEKKRDLEELEEQWLRKAE
jgi:ABC-type glutathione transport system ATPase component